MKRTADAGASRGRDDAFEERQVRRARFMQSVNQAGHDRTVRSAAITTSVQPSPGDVVPVSSVTVSNARTTVVPTAITRARTPGGVDAFGGLPRHAVVLLVRGSWLSRLATPVCSTSGAICTPRKPAA